jgi:hypothetical protein
MAINKVSPATFTTGVLVGDTVATPRGGSDSIPKMTTVGNRVVSAALEVQSSKGALLLSRLTAAERNDGNFVPTNGMILYNTSTHDLNAYVDDEWERIAFGPGGDVFGPNASTVNHIAVFADDTGKLIADSGMDIDDVGDVKGPNLSVINHIPVFSDLTGKTIADSGVNISQVPAAFFARGERLLVDINQIGNLGAIQFVNDVGGIYVDALSPVQFITNDFGPDSQACSLFTGGLPSSSTTPSALVELQSTTGALVLSRMTTTQRDALSASPGMLLFNNETNFFEIYQGSAWVKVNTGSGGGDMSGPGSSIDSSIALFSGTSGELLKDSSVLIDALGNITQAENISANSIVVGSATGTPSTVSSALEVQTTTGAFVFSRMTSAQRDALTATDAMTIYNSDINLLQSYLDGVWTTLAAGGSGNVFGPSDSITNTIPFFADTTGKVLADSGILWSSLVINLTPTVIPFNLAQFADATGRVLIDSGISAASVGNVSHSGSSNAGNIAVFTDTTGTIIADSAVHVAQDPASNNNLFIGVNSGNGTGTGRDNISYGIDVLTDIALGEGNVGIGFGVAPSLTSGDANLGAGVSSLLFLASGSNNVSLGNQSSQENISGNQNVSVGVKSLQENLTDGNVAVGFEALQNSVEASGLVAVGLQAARANISGDSVTAIGSLCLFNNLASFNTALGAGAGYTISSGGQNTIVGADAFAENETGSNAVAIGYQSQNKSTVGENVSLGAFSLQNNVDGVDCVAVGFEALQANLASACTALGRAALKDNTEGILNTAAGATALSQNIDGQKNTALGAGALQDNDSASNCTAAGYNALSSQTTSTPSNNSAFGSESITSNETGTGLSAFGALSLSANQDGDYCSAFGYKSQATATSASNCTSMGYASLEVNTASGNTAVGSGAMLLNETGSNCTVVGFGAAQSNVSGSNLIAIGESALFGNEDGSNTVCVGTGACSSQSSYVNSIYFGTLADATANALTNAGAIGYNSRISISDAINIGNDCRIGINQPSPAYALHVSNVSNIADIGFDNSTGMPSEPASGGALYVSSDHLQYINVDGVINLTGPSGVVEGEYIFANITVNARGLITEAASGSIVGSAGEIDTSELDGTYTISLSPVFTARVDALEADVLALQGEVAALTTDVLTLQEEVEGVGGLIEQMGVVQAELLVIEAEIAGIELEVANLYTEPYLLHAPSVTLVAAQNIGALSASGGLLKSVPDTPLVSCTIAIADPVSTSTFTGDYYAPGQPTTLIDTYDSSTFNLFVGTYAGSIAGSGAANTAVGIRTLENLNDGNGNTSLGHMASRSLVDASSCISIGVAALYSNQNSDNNIAIGNESLYTLNGGVDNLSAGYFSSRLLLNGNSNISLGSSSARNNASGSDNISIGVEALYSATNTGKAIAIGSGALRTSNATSNIGIGFNALYNTSAGVNLAIGDSAGYTTSTGVSNALIGHESFYSNSTGSRNTGHGYQSGYYMGGNDNVAIGYQAGMDSLLSAAQQCVFIGSLATGNMASLSNAVAIGYNTTVSLSNSIVLGNGCNVGIGTSTPTASLSVIGGQIVKRTATATSYNVLSTDYLIAVTSTASARTITLPAASATNAGQVYYVKDESGGAGTNNITVNVSGGGNIDGASSIAIDQNYGLLMFYSSGSAWFAG